MKRSDARDSQTADGQLDAPALVSSLASATTWEFPRSRSSSNALRPSAREQAVAALQEPHEFPAVDQAVVSGDRIALAIDPSIPEPLSVIGAVLEFLRSTDVATIDIVLWEEASGTLHQAIRDEFADQAQVHHHRADRRADMRYVSADREGRPIYLNQWLVDADFVLPVVAYRALDVVAGHDPTGIFPALTDSATRLARAPLEGTATATIQPHEFAWLLGVQVMLLVVGGADGTVSEVYAGTPLTVSERITALRETAGDAPPPAGLVVASLDSDPAQQTWANVSRAAAAAGRFAEPGGVLVVWSSVSEPPSPRLAALLDASSDSLRSAADEQVHELNDFADETGDEGDVTDGGFPRPDQDAEIAREILAIAAEHRILLHSNLNAETVESLSFGVIETPDDLLRLSRQVAVSGVLHAAHLAGGTQHRAGGRLGQVGR